jgi:hypothetical protein
MNRNLLTALVVLAVAAVLSFGVTRSMRCRPPQPAFDVLQDVSWLTRELGLNPQQVEAVRKLQQDLRAHLENCDSMSCAARCQLGAVLFSETNGAAKVSELVETMCKAQAESERATLEHIQSIHKLLNTEQQQRYAELVNRCVCSTCQHQPQH